LEIFCGVFYKDAGPAGLEKVSITPAQNSGLDGHPIKVNTVVLNIDKVNIVG